MSETYDNDDIDFGAQAAQVKVPLFGYVLAGIASAIPAYLFSAIFDMPVEEFYYLYVPITLLCTYLLSLAYGNVALFQTARLTAIGKGSTVSHKELNITKAELEQKQKAVMAVEANNWSYFQNNVVFFGLFAFFAFYVLGSLSDVWKYSVSMVAAALLSQQFSQTFRPQ